VRNAAIVLATAGALAVAGIASPGPAEARGGFGPALAGGLIAGAAIAGVASSAYAWGPGYGYYGGYAPRYARGCPSPGYGEYYNCGSYASPGYGAPAYYGNGYGPW